MQSAGLNLIYQCCANHLLLL